MGYLNYIPALLLLAAKSPMSLDDLQFLESADNVKRRIQSSSGRIPSTDIARGIAACVRQGRMFYTSAINSPLEIRPLVQFYGLVAFAKAVVIAKRSIGLSSLHGSHGIKDVSDANSRVTDLRARFEGRGTFAEFNDIVRELNRAAYYADASRSVTSELALPTSSSTDLQGIKISLKELLRRQPNLQSLYEKTFNEKGAATQLGMLYGINDRGLFRIYVQQRDQLTDRVNLATWLADWRRRYPFLAFWRLSEAKPTNLGTTLIFENVVMTPEDEVAEGELKWSEQEQGFSRSGPESTNVSALHEALGQQVGSDPETPSVVYAVEPYEGRNISLFSLAYATLFLLSSLVRYRPDSWTHAVSGAALPQRPADDNAIALVHAFLEYNANHLPRLVYRVIDGHERY